MPSPAQKTLTALSLLRRLSTDAGDIEQFLSAVAAAKQRRASRPRAPSAPPTPPATAATPPEGSALPVPHQGQPDHDALLHKLDARVAGQDFAQLLEELDAQSLFPVLDAKAQADLFPLDDVHLMDVTGLGGPAEGLAASLRKSYGALVGKLPPAAPPAHEDADDPARGFLSACVFQRALQQQLEATRTIRLNALKVACSEDGERQEISDALLNAEHGACYSYLASLFYDDYLAALQTAQQDTVLAVLEESDARDLIALFNGAQAAGIETDSLMTKLPSSLKQAMELEKGARNPVDPADAGKRFVQAINRRLRTAIAASLR
ncbi:MAG: hypothetical protein ACFB3T_13450 [Geminicoccaceae bacterium]